MRTIRFSLLPGSLAISRLDPLEPVPMWAYSGEFFSITRSGEELSIVCSERVVPHDVRSERGWRALQAKGPFGFDEVGIAASFVAPLAEARVPLFVVSTFDTDFVLVKEDDLGNAIAALERAGHDVAQPA